MEKNKNKKKLFAIIGGSVLAFVLTIALSVSITLAYFGDRLDANGTLKMQGAVSLGDQAITMTATTDGAPVVPGATVSVEGTAVVEATAEGTTPTDFVVAFTLEASGVNFTADSTKFSTVTIGATEYGVKEVDEVYYVVAKDGADAATDLAVITGTQAAQNIKFTVETQVATTETNDIAGETITFTVEVVAVQAYAIDANNVEAPTIEGAAATIASIAEWTQA